MKLRYLWSTTVYHIYYHSSSNFVGKDSGCIGSFTGLIVLCWATCKNYKVLHNAVIQTHVTVSLAPHFWDSIFSLWFPLNQGWNKEKVRSLSTSEHILYIGLQKSVCTLTFLNFQATSIWSWLLPIIFSFLLVLWGFFSCKLIQGVLVTCPNIWTVTLTSLGFCEGL